MSSASLLLKEMALRNGSGPGNPKTLQDPQDVQPCRSTEVHQDLPRRKDDNPLSGVNLVKTIKNLSILSANTFSVLKHYSSEKPEIIIDFTDAILHAEKLVNITLKKIQL